MSTAAAPVSAEAGRIYHPLDRLRGTIRRFVVLDGLLAAGLFVLGWFWLGLASDFGLFKFTGFDWVQDAPRFLRAVALFGLGLVAAGMLVRRVLLRLNREFSYPALALVLEKRFPGVLGDKLITAVELSDVAAMEKYGYSGEMIRETIADARTAVGTVDVNSVFNWKRLRVKAITLVGVGLAGVGLSFAGTAAVTGNGSVSHFAWQFADVAEIWGERNLLLKNTPWPRRAHLEMIDFPENGDLRVGKDAPPPKVRLRPYQWVIADPTTWDGWRPLRGTDLDTLGIASAPADAAVDEMLAAADAADLGTRLDEVVARPSMSRTVRKVVIPTDVTLVYYGPKTSGTVSLTREPGGDFTGEVTGLKESVRFVVKGEDFATAPRKITLVPPPMLTKLTRTEYQPAYLYHPAPADGTFESLKGLRQVFADKDMSLTGDRSVITVPAGTEVEIAGTADKPLKRAFLTPKAGKVPGAVVGTEKPVEIPVTNDRFTIAFKGADAVTAPVAFDLTLVDPDDVTATRGILIQTTEDQGPQVELAVDVLRKQGNSYLCTPMAVVPFIAESVVRDDTGLSKVEFEFTATKVESAVVAGFQTQAVAGVWASVPLTPNLGSAIGPTVSAALATALAKGEKKTLGRLPVARFEDDYRALPKSTLQWLPARLTGKVDADRPDVVKQIKFPDATGDGFDLERALPGLRVTDSADVQPRYRVELNVVATDVNFENGPKKGQNVEPVRLLVISEQDLLAEISKDEEGLIGKLDEVLRRLRTAQSKLNETADRLVSPNPPTDILVGASVRAADILQDVAKTRDTTTGVLTDYRRLRREAETNRCNRSVVERWDNQVIGPFDAVLSGEFPAADAAMSNFQAPLSANRRPDDATTADARTAVAALIARMQAVRDSLGEALSITKLREDLRQILVKQQQVSAALNKLKVALIGRLFAPKINPIGPVTLAKGEKKTVKHAIDWNVFEDGQIKVRIETPDSGAVTAPADVTVTDDKNDFEYPLTAGDKPGEYTIRLVPSVGDPVTVKVTVK
ncbi:MAG: hypothetical protein ACRC7O_09285 [Fimbriiglobus sp.]